MNSMPPKKLLGCRFSTPYSPFCEVRTTNSEPKYILDFTTMSVLGSISTGFQWTGSTPVGSPWDSMKLFGGIDTEAFRAVLVTHHVEHFSRANWNIF